MMRVKTKARNESFLSPKLNMLLDFLILFVALYH